MQYRAVICVDAAAVAVDKQYFALAGPAVDPPAVEEWRNEIATVRGVTTPEIIFVMVRDGFTPESLPPTTLPKMSNQQQAAVVTSFFAGDQDAEEFTLFYVVRRVAPKDPAVSSNFQPNFRMSFFRKKRNSCCCINPPQQHSTLNIYLSPDSFSFAARRSDVLQGIWLQVICLFTLEGGRKTPYSSRRVTLPESPTRTAPSMGRTPSPGATFTLTSAKQRGTQQLTA